MKVIYIAGLSRSGTTFLQLLLASHPQIVALGEVAHVIRKPHAVPPCLCGEEAADCPFWGELLSEIKSNGGLKAHRATLDRFQAMFPGKILLDSSKSVRDLQKYYVDHRELGPVDLKVLFLVRDFRGWVPSVLKYWHQEGKRGLRQYLQNCYFWLRHNRRTLRYLDRSGVSYLCVSYEELVFDAQRQTSRIHEFLGVRCDDEDGPNLKHAVSHELFGSPTIKNDPCMASRIAYDHRWLWDYRSVGLAPLLLPVYRFNRHVYRELAVSQPPSALQEGVVPQATAVGRG